MYPSLCEEREVTCDNYDVMPFPLNRAHRPKKGGKNRIYTYGKHSHHDRKTHPCIREQDDLNLNLHKSHTCRKRVGVRFAYAVGVDIANFRASDTRYADIFVCV